MPTPSQTLQGIFKLKGLPEDICFETFAELLQALATYISVEIPNQSFSNVIVSNQQPGIADKNKLWVQLSNAGGFVAIRQYIGGVWAVIFPVPESFQWCYNGDSTNPPDGYRLMVVGDASSAPAYAAIMANAYPAGLTGPYECYPVVFVGL